MASVGVGGGGSCDDYAGFAVLEGWSNWDHLAGFVCAGVDTGPQIIARRCYKADEMIIADQVIS